MADAWEAMQRALPPPPAPVPAFLEAYPEAHSVPDPASAVEESERMAGERVRRLLAKKAERKARKAAERGASAGGGEVLEAVAAGDAEVALAGASAADHSAVRAKEAAAESRLFREPVRRGGDRASRSSITEEDPGDLPPKLALSTRVDLAELSTGDECSPPCTGQSDWNEAEDSPEEGADPQDLEPEPTCDGPYTASPGEHSADRHFLSPQQWRVPAGEGDAWMVPLEEMHVQGVEQALGAAYQPILSADGRHLYTDGEQVYMMACMEVKADLGAEPQVVHPVVDPCDPLHEAVMGSLPAACSMWGCLAGAGFHCYYGRDQYGGRGQAACRHAEDRLWDVSWEFLP